MLQLHSCFVFRSLAQILTWRLAILIEVIHGFPHIPHHYFQPNPPEYCRICPIMARV
jgi:hypothetical protein